MKEKGTTNASQVSSKVFSSKLAISILQHLMAHFIGQKQSNVLQTLLFAWERSSVFPQKAKALRHILQRNLDGARSHRTIPMIVYYAQYFVISWHPNQVALETLRHLPPNENHLTLTRNHLCLPPFVGVCPCQCPSWF